MQVTRQEQRSYVKITVMRGRNALGNRALPYRTVARWTAAFQRGRVAMSTRGPRTVCTNVARAVIAQCLDNDR